MQSTEPVPLPGAKAWVALDSEDCRVQHSPGIVTFVEKCGPGVRVSATDAKGQSLSLQQTTESEPATELTLVLSEEHFFAIPEAQVIVGIAPGPIPEGGPYNTALVRVFRSPSGSMITEAVMDGDSELSTDGVKLSLSSQPYAQLTATFNPGRWPTGAGLVLLGAGLLSTLAWPVRRLWLREGAQEIEGCGDLPDRLTQREEA